MLFTLDQVLHQIDMQLDEDSLLSLRVGLVAELNERHRGRQPISTFLNPLVPLLDSDGCYFGFDSLMRFTGYVTWIARSRSEQINENHRDSVKVLLPVDFHCQPGAARSVVSSVFLSALQGANELRYQRSKQGHQIRRTIRADKIAMLHERSHKAGNSAATLTARRDLMHTRNLAFKRTTDLGRYLRLMARSADWKQLSLASAIRKARRALDNGQAKFYFDADQRVIGLLGWAWLSKRTIARISQFPLNAVHAGELNEGDTLCIVDILGAEMENRGLFDDVGHDLFPHESNVLQYIEPTQDRPARFRVWPASERALIMNAVRNVPTPLPGKTAQ
jgi:hemolysin-activating ACP:hemolysin acyltransferase